MRIRIRPQEGGTFNIYIERTRPKEGRNIYLEGVTEKDASDVLRDSVRKMRGEVAVES